MRGTNRGDGGSTSAGAEPAVAECAGDGACAGIVSPGLGVPDKTIGGETRRGLHPVVSEGAAVVRAEAVIGSKEGGGGRLADGIHLAVVQTIDARQAGGGVVARPRGAGRPVSGVHRICGGEEEVGLLVHCFRLYEAGVEDGVEGAGIRATPPSKPHKTEPRKRMCLFG